MRRGLTLGHRRFTLPCLQTEMNKQRACLQPSPVICRRWLTGCTRAGIRTVAMESTGVYWIPLYQILEQRGFEVCLVNAHSLKSVPGRKSDVSDCQWIQYLHSVGLLSASFRPPDAICAVRSLWRHRGSLLQMASEHTLHMQKALSQMNLQIHHVLSDITGVSGQAILDAVLAGERAPMRLAKLCHILVKTPMRRWRRRSSAITGPSTCSR